MLVLSGVVPRLLVLIEGSKASFAELAGGDTVPSVFSHIASDFVDCDESKVSHMEALLQPFAQPPQKL